MLFSHLKDLSYQRSASEAFGFYIAYFLLFLVIAAIIGGLSTFYSSDEAEVLQMASRLGIVTVTIISIGLAFCVLRKKNLLKQPTSIGIIILVGLCAMFGGALLGLLPIAFLTMKKPISSTLQSTSNIPL